MSVDPERLVLEWAVGGSAAALATMAAQLIFMRGADGVALRELASFVGVPSVEVPTDVVIAALDELGIPMPSPPLEAANSLARWWARRVVAGDVTPIEGARELWGLFVQIEGLDHHLAEFGALIDDWDGLPEQRAEIDHEITLAAHLLLTS